MKLAEIVSTSEAIGRTRSRKAKTELLAALFRRLRPDEVPTAVAYLSGRLPQGTVGVGWASLRAKPPPAAETTLELLEVRTEDQAYAGPFERAAPLSERFDRG